MAIPSGARRGADGHRASVRGFTLIELMITIAIAVILLMVAVPSFDAVRLSSRLNTFSNNFVASVHLARSEAIKRNATVTLCSSTNGTSCGGAWNNGWIVLVGATRLHAEPALPTGMVLSESSALTSLSFDPSGVGSTAANLTLCRSTPSVGSQQRTITVSATGRPDVTRVTGATTCP